MKTSNYGRFNNPVAIAGIPVLNTHQGKVFWVDSNGGGGGRGTFNHPVLTLDAALALCTADKGDTVMVKAKHAETVLGAGGITLDKAGVNIIGLGHYDDRPTILMDGSTITGLVTAANTSIANCVFVAGHSDIGAAFLITAKGFRCEACHFEGNTASENFVKIFDCGAADNDCDGLQLIDNTLDFNGDAGELTPIILNKNTNDVKIIGNTIYGDFDTTPYAAIYSVNTEVHRNLEVAYNKIHNLHDANAIVGISMGSTGSTGFMHNNMCYALDVAGETPFVSAATGISLFQNWYNYTGGTTSGLVLPAIGTLA
jgi:hypothetical protein